MTWRPSLPPAAADPERLGPSLARIASRFGLSPPELLTSVFAHWDELVGPDVAAHATPRSLRDGVLTVVVDHPAWATSLRLLSADVLARIGEVRGGATVDELVVQVAGAGVRGDRPRKGR